MTMEQPAGYGRQQVPADNRRARQARSWYWLAAGLLACALAMGAFGVHGVSSLPSQVAAFQRVSVPGQGGVIFDQPGLYLFYIEKPDRACSKFTVGGGGSPLQNGSMRLRMLSASAVRRFRSAHGAARGRATSRKGTWGRRLVGHDQQAGQVSASHRTVDYSRRHRCRRRPGPQPIRLVLRDLPAASRGGGARRGQPLDRGHNGIPAHHPPPPGTSPGTYVARCRPCTAKQP